MEKGKPILYIVTIIVAIIILALNRKESIKYFSITATSTGLLLIITKIMEVITMKTQNILILNQAFSKIVVNIIEEIMTKFLVFGIVFLIIGIAVNLVDSIKLNSSRN